MVLNDEEEDAAPPRVIKTGLDCSDLLPVMTTQFLASVAGAVVALGTMESHGEQTLSVLSAFIRAVSEGADRAYENTVLAAVCSPSVFRPLCNAVIDEIGSREKLSISDGRAIGLFCRIVELLMATEGGSEGFDNRFGEGCWSIVARLVGH